MKLLWQIDTQVDPRYLSLMQTAADCALWMEGVSRPCTVNIRICGDDAIHEINREYRGVDRATDVLSFPMNELTPGAFDPDACEWDYETDRAMLGASWMTRWMPVCSAISSSPCRMCWRRRRSMGIPRSGRRRI